MTKEEEKIKLSRDIDFIKIIEDQKPDQERFEQILDDNIEIENKTVNKLDWNRNYVYFCKICKEVRSDSELITKDFRWKTILTCKNCWSERIVEWIEESLKKYYRVWKI